MADLPDIDTTQVNFIAFWNAIDQGGVTDIDPSEVTSQPNIISHTVFDNGIEGVYDSNTGRDINFRVKEDGWLVTWVDRSELFNQNVADPNTIRGPWDLMNDWTNGSSDSQLITNNLERAIRQLTGEFSNFASMNYVAGDVGLFNFEFDTATTTSLLSKVHSTASGATSTETPGFSYTSATDLLWAIAAGTGAIGAQDSASSAFEGVTLANAPNVGVIDLLAQGLIPTAGTEFTHTLTGSLDGFTPQLARAKGDVLIVWT